MNNPGRNQQSISNQINQISINLLSYVSVKENLSDYCNHTDEKY